MDVTLRDIVVDGSVTAIWLKSAAIVVSVCESLLLVPKIGVVLSCSETEVQNCMRANYTIV